MFLPLRRLFVGYASHASRCLRPPSLHLMSSVFLRLNAGNEAATISQRRPASRDWHATPWQSLAAHSSRGAREAGHASAHPRLSSSTAAPQEALTTTGSSVSGGSVATGEYRMHRIPEASDRAREKEQREPLSLSAFEGRYDCEERVEGKPGKRKEKRLQRTGDEVLRCHPTYSPRDSTDRERERERASA